MPSQFSQDDDIANAGVIVHVWAVSIAPDDCTAAAQRLSTLMQDTVSGFPGFLKGEVLEADDQQSVLALSHWRSRHIWAQAQWNEEVGKTITALFQAGTKMVDTMYYVRSVTRNTADPRP
jgi:hypothetical protein